MASERAAAAEEFARIVLRLVEALGRDGVPVPLRRALEQALAAAPEAAYARWLREKPARRMAFGAVIERVRAAEFPHLRREAARPAGKAPVQFRVVPAAAGTGRADPASAGAGSGGGAAAPAPTGEDDEADGAAAPAACICALPVPVPRPFAPPRSSAARPRRFAFPALADLVRGRLGELVARLHARVAAVLGR